MSKFAVEIRKVSEKEPIENADAIEIAYLDNNDYPFVVKKDQFKEGDLVVHFPLNSELPEPVLRAIGFWDETKGKGVLSGAKGNRVKTVKLRGQISQGVLADPGSLGLLDAAFGSDVTEMLGVSKYEEEPIFARDGNLVSLDQLQEVSRYDIENAEHYPLVVASLLDSPVVVTEKLEGSHFALLITDEGATYCQRNFFIKEPEDNHRWVVAAANVGLPEKAIEAFRDIARTSLVFRGEVIGPGVQGNIYKLPRLAVYVFEIEVDGRPMDANSCILMCHAYDIAHVPVIAVNRFEDILKGKPLREFSDGVSQINESVAREGVVIRPIREIGRLYGLDRVIIKQRGPQYLAAQK